MRKRLYRSKKERLVAGVLGGLGEYFDIDPVWLRLMFVFISALTGLFPGLLVYLVGWIIIPEAAADEMIRDVDYKVTN